MSVVPFYSKAQLEFAQLCIECGCPGNLNMSIARLVFMLGGLD